MFREEDRFLSELILLEEICQYQNGKEDLVEKTMWEDAHNFDEEEYHESSFYCV